jgi:Holliday junction resolvase
VANSSKRKGDRAEREACALLSDLTGYNIRRALGAGRKEDVGDVFGLPNMVLQIADWTEALRAFREKPLEAERQRLNAGVDFAATLVRMKGGVWRSSQTLEQLVAMWRESQALWPGQEC